MPLLKIQSDVFESFSASITSVKGTEEDQKRHEIIRDMLIDFSTRLYEQEGDNLLQIVLYGSVARGGDHDGSDIDLFILLRHADDEAKRKILSICLDISFEYGHYGWSHPISPIIMELQKYREEYEKALLYYHIRDEGITVWL